MDARLRFKILAEWRGLPEIPFPKDTAVGTSELIPKLMKKLGLSGRLHEEEIRNAWRSVVGDFIAQHSTPQKLAEGILYVRVLQSSVHYELDRVWRPQIVQKLKQRFGNNVVRDVRFRLG